MYRDLVEQLAVEFQQNPVDYVAEADIQIALVEQLRLELEPVVATAEEVSIEGGSPGSFKRDYWQTVQQKLSEKGRIDRVHAEVSVQQGERLDVAVFQPELTHPIQWVSGGSKRFNEDDLECVFELKFVKNKTSFPNHSEHPIRQLAKNAPSTETLLQKASSDDPVLDFSANKIRADIHELNRLDGVDARFLLLFSNNNYLYHEPTAVELDSYRYGDLYHRLGKAARRWMREEANDAVEILYIHPRGMIWITES